jgi:hypothetical protein
MIRFSNTPTAELSDAVQAALDRVFVWQCEATRPASGNASRVQLDRWRHPRGHVAEALGEFEAGHLLEILLSLPADAVGFSGPSAKPWIDPWRAILPARAEL